MNHLGIGLCLVVMASLCAVPASATLIGDEVRVTFDAPSDGLSVGPTSINPVQAGDGDVLDLVINFGHIMRVNVEESSILLTLLQGTAAGQGINFGNPVTMAFLDLDWIGTPGIITAVNIIDNTLSLNADLAVGFTNGATGSDINLTLSSSQWLVGQGLTLDIETTHVPEPTTMALLATGAAGLIAKRRRVV